MTPCVNVCAPGYWDEADSYGILASQLARQLTRRGCCVNAYGLGSAEFGNQSAETRAVTTRPRVPTLGGIFLGYPANYHRHGAPFLAGPRVALTMFESSRIPSAWVPILNGMDAIITPSRFCAEAFAACGVTAPVHVVPLGLSPAYTYAPRDPNRLLTFLAFMDRGPRKGGYLALNAFVGAFGDRADVRLILKWRARGQAPRVGNGNVTVIARDMSEAELHQLYLDADVLISPTTGEGFGLLPREFAATGGISLATNWSGTAEAIDLWGVPLPYTLAPAQWHERDTRKVWAGEDLGEWAMVSRGALSAVLRRVADNRDFYAARARRNAPKVAQMYRWDRFGQQVFEVWEGVSHGDYRRAAIAA